MKIGIMATENSTGVGRVFQRTSNQLGLLYKDDNFWLFQALNAKRRFEFNGFTNVDYKSVSVPIIGRYFRDRDIVKRAEKLNLDIIHDIANGGMPLAPTRCKVIQTIHDVVPLVYPKSLSGDVVRWYRWIIPKVVKKANSIIVVGDSVKNDLIRLFKIPTDKITVAEPAPDDRFKPVKDTSIVRSKYKLPDNFVLFLGNVNRKRNIHTLIDAFALIADKIPDIHLVIAGGYDKDSVYVKQLFEKTRKYNLNKRVIWLGYVDDNLLPDLYSAARVFAYVPYWEGFPLPPLEAMKCGTCAVTTNSPPLLDVVGDAAVKIGPDDTKAMADALSSLVLEEETRKSWQKRGFERAMKFTWENATRKIYGAYKKTLS